ncbi:hypothetical protein O6H91_08G012300 [Diphasiastrum complanatum]|uniref:Uncharacterized protein n=1 Tax=Diphasiastrum complanatum TaxID=34168 RepID=A0ACC2CV10_DIPCM|nr:hypothetical protein O6H91_08G012300 [Diphasiastrum complanatum]
MAGVMIRNWRLVVELAAVRHNVIPSSLHLAQAHSLRIHAGLRCPVFTASKEVSTNSIFGKLDSELLYTTTISRAPSRLYKKPAAGSADTEFPEDSPGKVSPKVSTFEKVVEILTTLFPVWIVFGTFIGIWKPSAVTWLQTDLFTVSLGVLMLSLGLTLRFDDFRRCLRNPWTVGVGFVAQYFVKPCLGFLIAMGLKLSAPLATGLILVSCCPGSRASNVATYISKGNVALSVLMTTASTISAILMTPLLTKVLAGQLVPVDAVGLAISTVQVVLVPTVVGGKVPTISAVVL